MSEWWFLLAVAVVLVAAVVLYVRRRDADGSGGDAGDPSRDYRGERETGRLAGMSDEDREWEAASIERNRQSRERNEGAPADASDEPRRWVGHRMQWAARFRLATRRAPIDQGSTTWSRQRIRDTT